MSRRTRFSLERSPIRKCVDLYVMFDEDVRNGSVASIATGLIARTVDEGEVVTGQPVEPLLELSYDEAAALGVELRRVFPDGFPGYELEDGERAALERHLDDLRSSYADTLWRERKLLEMVSYALEVGPSRDTEVAGRVLDLASENADAIAGRDSLAKQLTEALRKLDLATNREETLRVSVSNLERQLEARDRTVRRQSAALDMAAAEVAELRLKLAYFTEDLTDAERETYESDVEQLDLSPGELSDTRHELERRAENTSSWRTTYHLEGDRRRGELEYWDGESWQPYDESEGLNAGEVVFLREVTK